MRDYSIQYWLEWWSENRSEKNLFMVQIVRYFNGPPSHMTVLIEYRTPILFGIQMNLVFKCLVFRWLQYTIFFSVLKWIKYTWINGLFVCDISNVFKVWGDEHAQAGVDDEHEEEESDGQVDRNCNGPVLLRQKCYTKWFLWTTRLFC